MRPAVAAVAGSQALRAVRTDLVNESLYGRIASHCAVHFSAANEFALKHVADRPLFGSWLPTWDERAALMLSIPRTCAARMRGADLQRGERGGIGLAPHLRYCASCMREGYHSVIFQHYALTHCPRHAERLRDECASCHKRQVPSAASVRRFPFICPTCGAPHSTLDSQRSAGTDARAHDEALTPLRRALASAAREATRHWKVELPTSLLSASVLAKHVQRALMVDFPAALPVGRWRFRRHRFKDAPKLQELSSLSWKTCSYALAPVLQWLSKHCPGADDACRLARMPGIKNGSYPTAGGASVLGTMLFKTLLHYALIDEFVYIHMLKETTIRPQTGARAPVRYSARLPPTPHMDSRLVGLEVLGLFAVLLAGVQPRGRLRDVDWRQIPDPLAWVPGWRELPRGGDGLRVVVMSVRADEKLLLRMFRRYESRWLW